MAKMLGRKHSGQCDDHCAAFNFTKWRCGKNGAKRAREKRQWKRELHLS